MRNGTLETKKWESNEKNECCKTKFKKSWGGFVFE